MPTKTKSMPPIHPGETQREDFLKPLGLTANRLATELFVPVTRVNDIVRGRRAIPRTPPCAWLATSEPRPSSG
jgi:addiction module HigA family antidote